MEMKMHINFLYKKKFGLPDFSNLDDFGGPFTFYF
jgi:hypothetical protein